MAPTCQWPASSGKGVCMASPAPGCGGRCARHCCTNALFGCTNGKASANQFCSTCSDFSSLPPASYVDEPIDEPEAAKRVLQSLHDVIGSPRYESVAEELAVTFPDLDLEAPRRESIARRDALVRRLEEATGQVVDVSPGAGFDDDGALAFFLYHSEDKYQLWKHLRDLCGNHLALPLRDIKQLQKTAYSFYGFITALVRIEDSIRSDDGGGSEDLWHGAALPAGLLENEHFAQYRKIGNVITKKEAQTCVREEEAVLRCTFVIRLITRPEDASGIHAPAELPKEMKSFEDEGEYLLPQMSNYLVLSSQQKTRANGLEYLEVAVDVTYIPQLFKDALKPPDTVWSELEMVVPNI